MPISSTATSVFSGMSMIGHRQAEVVIMVALGLGRVIRRLEDAGGHFLRGRLADGAGDADDLHAGQLSVARSDLAIGAERIFDLDGGQLLRDGAADQRGDRAVVDGRLGEIVPVRPSRRLSATNRSPERTLRESDCILLTRRCSNRALTLPPHQSAICLRVNSFIAFSPNTMQQLHVRPGVSFRGRSPDTSHGPCRRGR